MHTIRGVRIRVCVWTHMQGFACLLQPNSELQSDNRGLWVISHHASSGTAGGQEPRHISSHSDLGRKLPSLNSGVRERERGSQIGEPVIDNGIVGDKRNGGQTLQMKGKRKIGTVGLQQMPKSWCNIDQGGLELSVSVVLKRQIYNTTPLWWKKNHATELYEFSCVSFFCISLPLISRWLWLYCIERWLRIDLVSPLRTNVITALCLGELSGRWWRPRLAARQVGG